MRRNISCLLESAASSFSRMKVQEQACELSEQANLLVLAQPADSLVTLAEIVDSSLGFHLRPAQLKVTIPL